MADLYPKPAIHNFQDLTGRRFGRLTVIGYAGKQIRGRNNIQKWMCLCECGIEKIFYSSNLKQGFSQSCGCLHKELFRKRSVTHDLSGINEYKTWSGMHSRCKYDYPVNYRYKGRGIKVCERWNKFENFLEDMGKKPSPELTIERINNDGNYEPSNCKWATWNEQAANRSRPRPKN